MFRADSFRGGIHPPGQLRGSKALADHRSVKAVQPPEQVSIPLLQSIGGPCKSLVAKGDRVLRFQKIGEPTGYIGAPVHSSVSGTVLSIEQREIARGVFCACVLIQNDFQDELAPPGPLLTMDAHPQDMVAAIREAGIVGLGGAAFPTHVKLSPPPEKTVNTVIINGAECEPYLTSDHHVMLSYPEEVAKGLRYAMKILGAQSGIIAIEDNKPDAIESMRAAVSGQADIQVRVLKAKYPQGSEKQLIIATTGRQVPSGGLPADAGCVVINVSTAAYMTRALETGRPLVERVLTVSGRVKNPGNFHVRVGTPVKLLLEAADGHLSDAGRLVIGGPMMGVAASSDEFPTVKAMGGVLVLAEKDLPDLQSTECIHCGRCVAVCPMRLMPTKLYFAARREDWSAMERLRNADCMECGSCSFICPAKIELLSRIRIAKRALIARRNAKK